MTLGLILTILLAVLDYTGQVSLNVWQILIPVFIEVGLYVLFWVLLIAGAVGSVRR